MHVPFLDPQLYLPLEMNDLEMLSPEPGGHFFCGFSPPYFTCAKEENCGLSLEEVEGPGF